MESRIVKGRHKALKYRVLVAVECIKEYNVVARDVVEAGRLAEARATKRNKNLANKGYIVGDVETALIEEREE